MMQDSLLFKQFSVLFQKPHAVFKLFSECFVGQHVGDSVDIIHDCSCLVGGIVTDVIEGKCLRLFPRILPLMKRTRPYKENPVGEIVSQIKMQGPRCAFLFARLR